MAMRCGTHNNMKELLCALVGCVVLSLAVQVAADFNGQITHDFYIDVPVPAEADGLVTVEHHWNLPPLLRELERVVPALIGGDLSLRDELGDAKLPLDDDVRLHSAVVWNGNEDVDREECTTNVFFAHHSGMQQVRTKEPYVVPVEPEQRFRFVIHVESSSPVARMVQVKYSIRVVAVPEEGSSEYEPVTPLFLPVGGCHEKIYEARTTEKTLDFSYSDAVLPADGNLVYSLGFLTTGGTNVYLQHRENGRVLFNAEAEYAEGLLEKVSYNRDPVVVRPGDAVRVAAIYSDDAEFAYGWVLIFVDGDIIEGNPEESVLKVTPRARGFEGLEAVKDGSSSNWFLEAGLPLALTVLAMIAIVCCCFGLAVGASKVQEKELDEEIQVARVEERQERLSIAMERASMELLPQQPRELERVDAGVDLGEEDELVLEDTSEYGEYL